MQEADALAREGSRRAQARLGRGSRAPTSSVLALVPSERSFLDSQGLVIVAMACVTGFAVAVAGSGWWNVPITHVLWLGVVWTVVICIVDRLIYKSFGTSRRTNLVLALPRAALSLMLALVLGLPMVQFIFKPSISNQLSQTSAARAEGRAEVGALVLRAEDQAGERADRRDPGARDGAREPDQQVHALCRAARTTSRRARPRTVPGCGHWCQLLRAAGRHRPRCPRTRPARRPGEDRGAQSEDRRVAEDRGSRDEAPRRPPSRRTQDLLARAQALSTIEKQHPEVSRYVLFVLGLFVCLDLVALVMKLSHLLIGGAVYEEVAAALRERDRLQAHRLREQTAVLRKPDHRGGAGRRRRGRSSDRRRARHAGSPTSRRRSYPSPSRLG